MRPLPATLLLAGIAVSAPAHAQGADAIARCHDLQSTVEIEDCLGKLLPVADRRLNAAYQRAIAGLDPRGIPDLRASERAWLEYRNKRCAAIAAGDGTIGRVIFPDCMVTMTKARAEELETDAKGLAGN